MRLFVGLALPQEYQDGLADLAAACRRRGLAGLSFTRPGNWHLTLRFLGEVDEARVEELAGALRGVAWEAFTLRGGGAGAFPDLLRPRVAWIGLAEGGEECRRLAESVQVALAPLGFAPEERKFSPHLTLARVKGDQRREKRTRTTEGARKTAGGNAAEDVTECLREAARRRWPACVVREMVLWRSVLGGGGPAYTRLAEFPALGPGPRCSRPG
ncbi:2'-5' RNA ligase [Desulfovibrio sp. X2]|uniref:RNA 2',3'-cyclic phosphodiesterase n=1 Tax=Desulfovibrio sp. X2 TaxID=941449 RepID=UPI000358F3EF|nr:RNA 2',3'-cyclic phosphodiesterase [Desulfovibrio sp. X2]EPR44658.1 2'-5' RNA ligase [Desulfovibrio sp. X2]